MRNGSIGEKQIQKPEMLVLELFDEFTFILNRKQQS